jgi:5-methylcytosine-specific restriction endonuclease McrA
MMPRRAEQYRPLHYEAAQRERQRKRALSNRFYKQKEWLRMREWFLQQPENVLCAICKRAPAVEVDHIIPRRQAPHLALDPQNLQGACSSCHSAKTRREQQQ